MKVMLWIVATPLGMLTQDSSVSAVTTQLVMGSGDQLKREECISLLSGGAAPGECHLSATPSWN